MGQAHSAQGAYSAQSHSGQTTRVTAPVGIDDVPDTECGAQAERVPDAEHVITDIVSERQTSDEVAASSPRPSRPKKAWRSLLKTIDSYAVEERPGSMFGGLIRSGVWIAGTALLVMQANQHELTPIASSVGPVQYAGSPTLCAVRYTAFLPALCSSQQSGK